MSDKLKSLLDNLEGFSDLMADAMDYESIEDTSPEKVRFVDVGALFKAGNASISYNPVTDEFLALVSENKKLTSLYFSRDFWHELILFVKDILEDDDDEPK